MKKVVALLLTTVMAVTSLAGCGSENSSSASTTSTSAATNSESAGSKKNITLTFGSHQSGLPTSGIVQKIAQDYEAETGVKIDFQIIPDAQWRDLLKVKLDSGEAYDIMNVDADPLSIVSRINPEVNAVDLSDQEWVKRIDPLALAGVSVNNKVYGIQFNGIRKSGMFYNKKMFNDLGLKAPTTYEEFKNVSRKIKDSGVIPIYEAIQNGWHQVLPIAETGSYYTTKYDNLYEKLNKNEMRISDIKEMKLILTQMKEFADSGFYGKNFMSQSVEGAKEAFAKGEVAMFYNDGGWALQTETEFPETKGNIGFFSAPWADNQTISSNPTCNAYFINKNSKYIDDAKNYFNFLAKHENLQKLLDEAGSLVSLCWPEIGSKENPEYVEYYKSLPQGIVIQVGVSYFDPQWMDIGKDIDAMYAGSMTPEQVVNNIEKRRDDLADLAKDPAWNK